MEKFKSKSKFNRRDLQSMNQNNWIYQGTTAIEPFASTVSQFAQSLRMPLFLLCLFCFLIAISIISPASETSAIHKHLEDHFGLGGVQSITDALVVPRKTREVTFLYFLSVIPIFAPEILNEWERYIYTILCQKCLLTRKVCCRMWMVSTHFCVPLKRRTSRWCRLHQTIGVSIVISSTNGMIIIRSQVLLAVAPDIPPWDCRLHQYGQMKPRPPQAFGRAWP